MLDFRRFLFLLVVLVVRIWLVKALFRRILPVPVFRNLLAAPLLVFIFGILCQLHVLAILARIL